MDQPLTQTQLELVRLLANGYRVDELPEIVHRSISSVKKTLAVAKERAGAKTLPHLVSIVIASGVLEWVPDDSTRKINNGDATDETDPPAALP